jgi:hypothetical protein
LRHLALQQDDVTGHDLTTESCVFDTAEEWKPPGVLGIREHCHAAALRERLEQQDTRRRGTPRKMSGKEPLVATQAPETTRALAGFDGEHLIQEEKRRAMR